MHVPLAKTAKLGMVCTVIMTLSACRIGDLQTVDSGSGFSQLTKKDHDCKVWDSQRLSKVKGMVRPFTRNVDGNPYEEKYYQAMAGLPDHYLSYLALHGETRGFYVSLENPGFEGGVTNFSSAGPNSIKIKPSRWAIDFTTQHEVGHAVQLFVGQEARKRGFDAATFDRELVQIARGECTNPNLNSYPISYGCYDETYLFEFFAEAYNSYYCKEETQIMVKEQFPATYAFLQKYLEPPVWEQTSGESGTPDTGMLMHLAQDGTADSSSFTAYIAGGNQIASAAICLGTLAECKQSQKQDVATKRVTAADSRRIIFMTLAPIPVNATATVTLLGFDGSGKLVNAVGRKFRAK